MSLTVRATVYPDTPGGFTPDSFTHLLQTRIHLPGLDPAWTHLLIDVSVADGGDEAVLTVVSDPISPLSLEQTLRVVNGTPPAHIRVHGPDGTVLAEIRHPAPLHEGQEVEHVGAHYRVTSTEWPGRHPEFGYCQGGIDWQHVTVSEHPRAPVAPTAAE